MGKKVMTVDDSSVVRQILKKTLSAAGYEVLEAVDGQDALNKLSTSPVDMVVTDLNMPNMDGVELIKSLRRQPGNRFLPIVMLTTESQQQIKEEGKKAGASGWIVKPFRPEQLLAVVRTVLG
ncbi:MAG: response regulator [Desulfuromonadales bacterium]|nr:response regulator [Desulfuromonadales bacterium]MDT8422940.1 response regulator [Desulfuromonadales bacterium]